MTSRRQHILRSPPPPASYTQSTVSLQHPLSLTSICEEVSKERTFPQIQTRTSSPFSFHTKVIPLPSPILSDGSESSLSSEPELYQPDDIAYLYTNVSPVHFSPPPPPPPPPLPLSFNHTTSLHYPPPIQLHSHDNEDAKADNDSGFVQQLPPHKAHFDSNSNITAQNSANVVLNTTPLNQNSSVHCLPPSRTNLRANCLGEALGISDRQLLHAFLNEMQLTPITTMTSSDKGGGTPNPATCSHSQSNFHSSHPHSTSTLSSSPPSQPNSSLLNQHLYTSVDFPLYDIATTCSADRLRSEGHLSSQDHTYGRNHLLPKYPLSHIDSFETSDLSFTDPLSRSISWSVRPGLPPLSTQTTQPLGDHKPATFHNSQPLLAQSLHQIKQVSYSFTHKNDLQSRCYHIPSNSTPSASIPAHKPPISTTSTTTRQNPFDGVVLNTATADCDSPRFNLNCITSNPTTIAPQRAPIAPRRSINHSIRFDVNIQPKTSLRRLSSKSTCHPISSQSINCQPINPISTHAIINPYFQYNQLSSQLSQTATSLHPNEPDKTNPTIQHPVSANSPCHVTPQATPQSTPPKLPSFELTVQAENDHKSPADTLSFHCNPLFLHSHLHLTIAEPQYRQYLALAFIPLLITNFTTWEPLETPFFPASFHSISIFSSTTEPKWSASILPQFPPSSPPSSPPPPPLTPLEAPTFPLPPTPPLSAVHLPPAVLVANTHTLHSCHFTPFPTHTPAEPMTDLNQPRASSSQVQNLGRFLVEDVPQLSDHLCTELQPSCQPPPTMSTQFHWTTLESPSPLAFPTADSRLTFPSTLLTPIDPTEMSPVDNLPPDTTLMSRFQITDVSDHSFAMPNSNPVHSSTQAQRQRVEQFRQSKPNNGLPPILHHMMSTHSATFRPPSPPAVPQHRQHISSTKSPIIRSGSDSHDDFRFVSPKPAHFSQHPPKNHADQPCILLIPDSPFSSSLSRSSEQSSSSSPPPVALPSEHSQQSPHHSMGHYEPSEDAHSLNSFFKWTTFPLYQTQFRCKRQAIASEPIAQVTKYVPGDTKEKVRRSNIDDFPILSPRFNEFSKKKGP